MAEYITELANDIAKSCPDLVENGCGNDNCVTCLAFKLIGLGYTKQSDTADVVPKSEVEESLPLDVHEALKQRAVEKAKAEVAREIFEEIEKKSSSCVAVQNGYELYETKTYTISALKLDELKKKYTEGEE